MRRLASILLASILTVTSARARADVPVERPIRVTVDDDVLGWTSRALAEPRTLTSTLKNDNPLMLAPHDIRLSRGAKTAIIVGAIVGGILIVVGAIALSKPHRL